MKIIDGLKNYWKWRKIIYNDSWWDSHFLFDIMRFKIEQMETGFRNHGWGVMSEKDADKMKICKLLLDRIIKDDYYDNVFKYHYEKWGESEFTWNDTEDPELVSLEITCKNAITDDDKIQEREEFRNLMGREGVLKKQDIDYLFKLMSKHILYWWD